MSVEGETPSPLNIDGAAKSFAAQSTLVPSDQTRLQDPLQAVVKPGVVTNEARLGTYRGQIWDDFEIGELIGHGGMGAVYRGRQLTLDRPVAIKVLGRHLSEDENFKQRFLREARAVAQINSPNVVQIYSAGTHDGHHFFVMELIEGVDLAQMLRDGFRPSNAQAFDLILQAARGLVAAGRLGLVHRDIKPANMLLTCDRVLKITDFGLVKLLAEDASQPKRDGITATGIIIGTAGYFSPEQGLGERCDQRTDIYALGVVAFQLLTGRLPFTAEDTTSVIYQHVHEPPPRIRAFNASVHAELERVILGCLQKKPSDRPQSAESLVHDLEQIAITGCISRADGSSSAWRWGMAAAAMLTATAVLSVIAVLITHRQRSASGEESPAARSSIAANGVDNGIPLDGEQRHQSLSALANDSDTQHGDAADNAPAHEKSAEALESADASAIQHAPAQAALPPALAPPLLPLASPAPVVNPPAPIIANPPARSVQTPPHHPAHDPLAGGPLLSASEQRTYAPLPAQLVEPEEPQRAPAVASAPVVVPVVSASDGAVLTSAPAATASPVASDPPALEDPATTATTQTPAAAVAPAAAASSTSAVPAPETSATVADTSDACGRYRDVHILSQTARFRWCPPCRFLMGSPPDEPHRNADEQLHLVELSHGYWIMDRECPQSLWDAIKGYDPANNQDLNCPIENVSWNEVQSFIKVLNRITPGLSARLPSEAEWECAARAGSAPTVRPPLSACAWYSATAHGQSQHCATLQANAWGLFDCLGNVAEWCGDSYGPYQGPLVVDPNPHDTSAPVIRGGSFRDGVADCRLAQRDHERASFSSARLGFRLAASAVPAAPGAESTRP